MKKILLYGWSEQSAQVLQQVCVSFDIPVYVINDSLLEASLKEVFGINEDLENLHEEFAGSYMLIRDIANQELLKILKEDETQDRAYEGIIVSYTDTNAEWPLRTVFVETKREHTVLRKARVLQMMIQAVNDMDYGGVALEQAQAAAMAAMDGLLYLKSGNITEEGLDEKIMVLSKALRKMEQLSS